MKNLLLTGLMALNFLIMLSQGTPGSVLFVHADNASSYSGSGTTWSDISGNGNDGTIAGATYDATNKVFVFDGNDHVSFSPVLTEGDDTYTLEAYFKSTSASTQVVLEQNTSSVQQSRRACILLLSSGVGGFNGASNDRHNVASYTTNSWEHWVLVCNVTGNNLKIFRNGSIAYDGTFANSGALNVGTGGVNIGKRVVSNGEYFVGEMKYARIYDRVLTDAEAVDNYNSKDASCASFTVDAGADQTICSGSSITLTAGVSSSSSTNTQTFTSANSNYSIDGETNVTGMTFNNDGTKMFLVGTQGNDVTEYSLSTAYDVSTAIRSGEFDPLLGGLTGIAFNNNGTKIFLLSESTDKVHEYNLTTAFLITSGVSFSQEKSVVSGDNCPTDLQFNNDGSKMYILGCRGDRVDEYDLSTPYDISTAGSSPSRTQNTNVSDSNPRAVVFSADGSKMFTIGLQNKSIREFSLSTPFNVTTSSSNGTHDLTSVDGQIRGMAFNANGTKIYFAGQSNDKIYEYDLIVPYDLFGTNSFTYSWDNNVSNGVAFSPTSSATYTVTVTDVNGCTKTDAVDVTVNALPTVDAGADQGICLGGNISLSALQNFNPTITNNLVGWWPLNGSIDDESSNNNTTSLTGGNFSSDRNNINQNAYNFSQSSYIEIDDNNNFDFSSSYSISFWINPLTVSGGWYSIISKDHWHASTGFLTYIANGVLTHMKAGGSQQISANISANIWTHITIVNNNGSATLYKNGVAVTNSTLSIQNNSVSMLIGRRHENNGTGTTNQYEGGIDEVGIWNYPLDSSSVMSLFGGYNPIVPSFVWSNGGITESIIVSPQITTAYTVTATNANGCISTDQVDVTVNPVPTSTVSSMDALCNGSSDGSATVTSSGGTAPYTYLWDDGQTTAMAGALTAGSYTVTVTDANGCTETQGVAVLEPSPILVVSTSQDSVSCYGLSDGSASVGVIGGTGLIMYMWDSTAGNQTTDTAMNLSAGTYTLSLMDVNGCFEDTTIVVEEPLPLTITNVIIDSISCYGLSDGSASVGVIGGTGLIMYMWDSTAGNQTTDTAINLSAGTYNLSLMDINGCFEDTTVTVFEPQPLIFTNVTSDSISCYGGSDGLAFASAIGGTGSIMYIWDSTAGNQTTDTATNLSAGIYNLSVMDANGCFDDTTITVGEPNLITGSEFLFVCDSLLWNGNLLSSSGIYVDTLQSVNSCDSVATLDLTVSDLLFSIDTSQQNLVANISGGTAPYSYEWSTGDTSDFISPSINGQYWLIVYDADLCSGDTVFFDVIYLPNVGIIDNGKSIIVNVYPNPTFGNVNIELAKQQSEVQIALYDMYGKLVYLNKYQDTKLIEFSFDAPPGVYYLNVKSGDRSSRHKIIMQ